MAEDLFDAAEHEAPADAPLAVRMRPRTLDEVVGQRAPARPRRPAAPAGRGRRAAVGDPVGAARHRQDDARHLVSPATGRPLPRAVGGHRRREGRPAVVEEARRALGETGAQTVLFVDEVHRFSKTQQDALLPSVENRWVTLVAATTENPFFSVISPLLSRSLLLTLEPLTDDDVRGSCTARWPTSAGSAAAIESPTTPRPPRPAGRRRRPPVAHRAGGGAGAALGHGRRGRPARRRPEPRRPGRGALRPRRRPALRRHQRLHQVDPRLATSTPRCTTWRGCSRRGRTRASSPAGWSSTPARTSGMADPSALQVAVAAAQALELIGMPEARLNLAQATIHLALAPKSNAVLAAVDTALADVRAGRAARCRRTCATPLPGARTRSAHGVGLRVPSRLPGRGRGAAVRARPGRRAGVLLAERPRGRARRLPAARGTARGAARGPRRSCPRTPRTASAPGAGRHHRPRGGSQRRRRARREERRSSV